MVPGSPTYCGPVNAIYGTAATPDHIFKEVIKPNEDTLNSMALLGLRSEPVLNHVPQITDRYYVPQFEDLFDVNPH